MSRLGCSLALIALGTLVSGPRVLVADDTLDGLDVTMEVLGDEAELDALVSGMRTPDDRGFRGGRLEDEDLDDNGEPGTGADDELDRIFPDEPDGFEHDVVEKLAELETEDAFESQEGDDLDYEIYTD